MATSVHPGLQLLPVQGAHASARRNVVAVFVPSNVPASNPGLRPVSCVVRRLVWGVASDPQVEGARKASVDRREFLLMVPARLPPVVPDMSGRAHHIGAADPPKSLHDTSIGITGRRPQPPPRSAGPAAAGWSYSRSNPTGNPGSPRAA